MRSKKLGLHPDVVDRLRAIATRPAHPDLINGTGYTIMVMADPSGLEGIAMGVIWATPDYWYYRLASHEQIRDYATQFSADMIDSLIDIRDTVERALDADFHTPPCEAVEYTSPMPCRYPDQETAISRLWHYRINQLKLLNKERMVGGDLPNLSDLDAKSSVMSRLEAVSNDVARRLTEHAGRRRYDPQLQDGEHLGYIVSGATTDMRELEISIMTRVGYLMTEDGGKKKAIFVLLPDDSRLVEANRVLKTLMAKLRPASIEIKQGNDPDVLARMIDDWAR